MRQNRIYITGILLLFAFLSGRAQQLRIDELECRNLKIGYEKTLHMIFPTPVKYLNMGDENIIGEVIQVCPSVIRLKSTVRDFKGETNLSVVTEDSRYYTYCISFDEGAQAVYKEGGTMPETAVLPVSDEKLTHVIYPEKIVYVDFGNTTVQVEKAENVNNIVALRPCRRLPCRPTLPPSPKAAGSIRLTCGMRPDVRDFPSLWTNRTPKRSRWPYWREESGIPGRKHCLKKRYHGGRSC